MLRLPRSLRPALLFLVGALLCVALAPAASARGRDPAREAAIERQLAQLDPNLVPLLRQATVAFDARNYAAAEAALAPIVAKFPDWDVGLRRLGSARSELGRHEDGVALVERAVRLHRSYDNVISLAYVLGGSRSAADSERERALALLHECAQLPGYDEPEALSLTAQFLLQLNRLDDARAVIARLQTRYPDQMLTHYLVAILAAGDSEWLRAEREIRAAGRLGLDPGTVESFLDAGVRSHAQMWHYARGTGWTVGLWALGLLVLCGLGYLLSGLTLRQIEKSDATAAIAPGEHRLRRFYRHILNVAGIYYYISLPIVVVLVIAVAVAVVVGIYSLGFIAIKLILIFGIGAVVTIVSLVRSLFVRVKATDPGRAVTRAEAAGLWLLAEEVARAVDTRPVDEIRLTVGTDLCVYERGSWRDKLRNRAKRILVVGTGVLDGFKQDDFRAVLAHEYGHFSHRDTAGGDIALRVRHDMFKFYLAMAEAGQATWSNLAFHFLRFYYFIFRRISHGASRLQEVLADRVAAQLYGAPAFEGGLRHVIRQSLEFEARAHREIDDAIKVKRPLQNFYDPSLPGGADVEKAFAEALARPTTADDTHPAPQDRFRLVARIPSPPRPVSAALVWDLFADRAAIVAEMLATVEKNIQPHRTRAALRS